MTRPFLPNGSPLLPSVPRLLRWEPTDTAAASALYEVFRAAHLADEPVEPPESPRTHRSLLTGTWAGANGEVWYLPGDAGEAEGSGETGGAGESSGAGAAVAYYRLDLPDLENTDRAAVGLYVHPAVRRRGLGRALLRHAAQRAAANGRATLDGVALEDSAGEAFARSVGATMGLEKTRQVQGLRAVSPERVAQLRAEAEQKAAGYSLVTWKVIGTHRVTRAVLEGGQQAEGTGVLGVGAVAPACRCSRDDQMPSPIPPEMMISWPVM